MHCLHPNTALYLNNYKRKEVITYPQNERQKKPSQNQYHQRLRIPARREAGDYCISEYWDRIHPESNRGVEEYTEREEDYSEEGRKRSSIPLEAKNAKADAKAAEEAKKTEAEAVLKKLLASGMSADEILEKLK